MATKSARLISATIDPKQRQMYDSLSSYWWDLKGPMKIVHSSNNLVVPYIQSHLSKLKEIKKSEPVTVLDVGCGGGIVAERLSRAGNAVVGIDIAPNLIEIAKKHAQLDPAIKNLTYQLEAVDEHASRNAEKYDAVLANFVLQDVKDQELFLSSCIKCLKPGGLFFGSTLSKSALGWFATLFIPEYVVRSIPRHTHNFDYFVSAKQFSKILEKNNCETKEVRGLYRKFFQEEWYWIGNTSTYFVLRAVKNE